MVIKTISSREVYRNPWTSVREDVIERANGQRGIYGVIDKDPACIIIPLEQTDEGEFVYLVEQFRYTVQERCVELPQGGWEMGGVDPQSVELPERVCETRRHRHADQRIRFPHADRSTVVASAGRCMEAVCRDLC